MFYLIRRTGTFMHPESGKFVIQMNLLLAFVKNALEEALEKNNHILNCKCNRNGGGSQLDYFLESFSLPSLHEGCK